MHACPYSDPSLFLARVSWHAMRCARAARLRTRSPPGSRPAGRPVAERCQSPPGKAARGPRLARPGQAPACALTPPLAASRCSTPTSMAARERGRPAPVSGRSFRRRSGGLSLLSALTLFGSKLSCQSRTMSIYGTAAATARACMATDSVYFNNAAAFAF